MGFSSPMIFDRKIVESYLWSSLFGDFICIFSEAFQQNFVEFFSSVFKMILHTGLKKWFLVCEFKNDFYKWFWKIFFKWFFHDIPKWFKITGF